MVNKSSRTNSSIEDLFRKLVDTTCSYDLIQKYTAKILDNKTVVPIELIKKLVHEVNPKKYYDSDLEIERKPRHSSLKKIVATEVNYRRLRRCVIQLFGIEDLIVEAYEDDPYYIYFVLDICHAILQDHYFEFFERKYLSPKERMEEKYAALNFAKHSLSNPIAQIRYVALGCLEIYPYEIAKESIISLLKDEDHLVRAEAAAVLWKIGLKKAPKILVDLLNDEYPYVRLCAILALGQCSSGLITDRLVEIIYDLNEPIKNRKEAVKTLSDSPDLRAVNIITDVISDDNLDAEVRASGVRAVRYYYENQVINIYSQILSQKDSNVTYMVADMLSSIRTPQSEELLFSILDNKYDGRTVRIALNSLGHIGRPKQHDKLLAERLLPYYGKLDGDNNEQLIHALERIVSPERIFDFLDAEMDPTDEDLSKAINGMQDFFRKEREIT